MSQPPPPPRRARHLLDPNNPRPPRRSTRPGAMSTTQVQRWVVSALAVTTLLHLVVGLIVAALFVDEKRLDAQIGLTVIAGAFAVIAVAVARAIHRKPILSPWLALGAVPALVGIWLVLR